MISLAGSLSVTSRISYFVPKENLLAGVRRCARMVNSKQKYAEQKQMADGAESIQHGISHNRWLRNWGNRCRG